MKRLFYLIAIVGFIITSCAETENPKPNEEKTYSFSIGAERETDNTDETRVEMIDGLMHWSEGDNVGMYIYKPIYPYVIVDKLLMTGLHNQPTQSTTFRGELTEAQIKQLDPNYMYHQHLTYYPYSAKTSMSSTTGVIQYDKPSNITLTKNVLPMEYMFMYANTQGGPMTWLDENGEQQWDEKKTLRYKHALSYLRLKLDLNLMGLPVTKVEIESIGYDIVYFYGTTRINVSTGSVTANGQTSVKFTIDIPEGFSAGDEIYIPFTSIPSRFTIRFTFANGLQTTKSVQNLNVSSEPGKIYNIAFKLPYIVSFGAWDSYINQPSIADIYFSDSFDYGGHTYLVNDRVYGSGYPRGLVVHTGTLTTPALDLSGKPEVPVIVSVNGSVQVGFSLYEYGSYYVNTAPNDITTYEYSTDGVRVTGRSASIPLVLTSTNSRVTFGHQSRSANGGNTVLRLSSIIISPQ